jgi:hypothetical protein
MIENQKASSSVIYQVREAHESCVVADPFAEDEYNFEV